MGELRSTNEDLLRLNMASVIVVNDILFSNISELIECRRKVAVDMLKCHDNDTYKVLLNIFERVDYHLKQLLAL